MTTCAYSRCTRTVTHTRFTDIVSNVYCTKGHRELALYGTTTHKGGAQGKYIRMADAIYRIEQLARKGSQDPRVLAQDWLVTEYLLPAQMILNEAKRELPVIPEKYPFIGGYVS